MKTQTPKTALTVFAVVLFLAQAPEIEKIHRKEHSVSARELAADSPANVPVSGELFDVRATFELGEAREVSVDIGGNRITYDVAKGQLGEAPLKPVNGRIALQALVDRPMMDIRGNDGRVYITLPREKRGAVQSIKALATGGRARLVSLEVFELDSNWKPRPRQADGE